VKIMHFVSEASKHAKLNEVEPAPTPPLWSAKLVYFEPLMKLEPNMPASVFRCQLNEVVPTIPLNE